MSMKPTVVWTEIPVTDIEASARFYAEVFGWKMNVDTSGPNPMAVFDGQNESIAGHLYPGMPAADGGNTIHLALPGSLEDGMARCTKAGGTVVSPAVAIPPGRFAYAKDPDGNSIGLFEPARRG